MRMKSFLNYFALKMILLNILQNFTIYLLFCFTHDNFSKWYISILQGKLKFLVLHNFTKFFLKIMFSKLLLDKGSSKLYVRTKIAKIRPPVPPCTSSYAIGLTTLHAYVLSIYSTTPPLLINFYSDSSICHSQFLGHFHFYWSLSLNFTKPISKRFLWFLFIA